METKPMQDMFYIETVQQAEMLLKPQRIELLKQLHEPRTCPELAAHFQQSPQKIYYHVKALEKAGLVEKVAERRVRGTVEGHYQAKAKSYWLAPHLVGQVGSRRQSQDQTSLRFLLSLAEEIHDDIGRLGHRSVVGEDVPSLGLSAQIYLPSSGRRAEFLNEVQQVFQDLARKFGLPADDADLDISSQGFKLVLACYPDRED